jgi:hypothetical protein
MDKTSRAMWTAGVTCPSQTLHRIVVTTRMRCGREVKSLCKELIVVGFSASFGLRASFDDGEPALRGHHRRIKKSRLQ